MEPEDRTIATVTNLAYVGSGIFAFFSCPHLWPIGVFTILLGFESGAHHWWRTDFTRILDYAGMYSVLLAIILTIIEVPVWWTFGITSAATIAMCYFLQDSRIAIGVLILAATFLLLVFHSPVHVFEAIAWLSIAFMFNFIGDNVHENLHSPIHGIGWHIPSSYSIFLIIIILS